MIGVSGSHCQAMRRRWHPQHSATTSSKRGSCTCPPRWKWPTALSISAQMSHAVHCVCQGNKDISRRHRKHANSERFSFVCTECPVGGGIIFGKPSKRAIWNTLGLHAVPPICLRFSSGMKTIWPKTAVFPVRDRHFHRLVRYTLALGSFSSPFRADFKKYATPPPPVAVFFQNEANFQNVKKNPICSES